MLPSVHYSGGDTCPSQHDVRRRVRAHYEEDFGAEHVELPAIRYDRIITGFEPFHTYHYFGNCL